MSEAVKDKEVEAPKERFHVTDDGGAYWAFRKLGEVKAKMEKVDKLKAEYDAQNEDWYAAQMNPLQRDWDNFANMIEEYRLTQVDGKVSTPAGSTSTRHEKVYKYKKEDLLAYLKANHPEYVKNVETSKWGDFKKTLNVLEDGRVVDDNGEIVPDMTVSERETVSYKPTKVNGD